MTRLGTAGAVCALGAAWGVAGVPSRGHPAEPRELVVFAAASLSEASTNLARTFEKGHRGTKVRLSFAGSQELRVRPRSAAWPICRRISDCFPF